MTRLRHRLIDLACEVLIFGVMCFVVPAMWLREAGLND